MKRTLISFTILLLLIAIALLIYILKKRPIIINTLNKNSISASKSTVLKYFYETNASVEMTENSTVSNSIVIYKHNKDGMNSLKDYPISHAKNVVRIAAVGDSFTYGLNVSTTDNWTTQLETMLNVSNTCNKKFEVLNFGVPGYDVNYTIEHIKRTIRKFNPDMYLWFIKEDDFAEPKELTLPIEKKLNTTSMYDVNYYLKALDLLYAQKNRDSIIKEVESNFSVFVSEEKKTQFLLVLPKGDLEYPVIDLNIKKYLINLSKKIKTISITEVELTKDDVFLPEDYHFNIEGNKKFAQQLSIYLLKKYCK